MKRNEFIKTVELLSHSHTAGDLWDELHKDIKPENSVLCPEPGKTYTLRLLGSFIEARRLYIPRKNLRKYLSLEEIDQLVFTKSKEITEKTLESIGIHRKDISLKDILTKLSDTASSAEKKATHPILGIVQFLYKLIENPSWTRCILVNVLGSAIGDHQGIYMLPLTDHTVAPLFKSTIKIARSKKIKPEGVRINGVYAHDIFLKIDARDRFSHNIDIDPKASFLSSEAIDFILSTGLIDIPKLLPILNESRNHCFLYNTPINYRITNDIMLDMVDIANMELENEHYHAVEETNPRDLPLNAFDDDEVDNSIGYLEL